MNDHDDDPLMLVLTGTEPDEETRADPAYRSAAADVAELRAQIRRLGDVLAIPPASGAGPGGVRPGPPRPPLPAPRRWPRHLLAACAAGVLTVGGVGLGHLAVNGAGGGAADGAKSAARDDAGAAEERSGSAAGPGPVPGYAACARLIVEGTVVRVDPVAGEAEERITLDVTRYHKPGRGEPRVTFAMDLDSSPRLRAGDEVLVGIPRGAAYPDMWSTGEDLVRDRAWIEKELSRPGTATC